MERYIFPSAKTKMKCHFISPNLDILLFVMQVYIYSQFLQLVVRRDISSQLSIRRRKVNNDGFEKKFKRNHSGQSCELSFQRVILKLLQQQLAIK